MIFEPSPPERLALGTLAGGVSASPRTALSSAPDVPLTIAVSRLEGPGLRWLRIERERRANREAFDAPARDRRAD